MSAKKWVGNSLRELSASLNATGFQVLHVTVGQLLKDGGFSLKGNRKESIGPHHPDRARQFRYIRRVKKVFQSAGHPIISTDAKKKELISSFKNPGRVWCQEAERVNVHDFPQDAEVQAIPYGIYDITHNLGYVAVGTCTETSEFAVDTICWWWDLEDRPSFPDESKSLILTDAGGSDGCRPRLWKKQLQEQLSDRLSIEAMVCHYSTGASRWNPIEHRVLSQINLNWAGTPLRSLEVTMNYVRGT